MPSWFQGEAGGATAHGDRKRRRERSFSSGVNATTIKVWLNVILSPIHNGKLVFVRRVEVVVVGGCLHAGHWHSLWKELGCHHPEGRGTYSSCVRSFRIHFCRFFFQSSRELKFRETSFIPHRNRMVGENRLWWQSFDFLQVDSQSGSSFLSLCVCNVSRPRKNWLQHLPWTVPYLKQALNEQF